VKPEELFAGLTIDRHPGPLVPQIMNDYYSAHALGLGARLLCGLLRPARALGCLLGPIQELVLDLPRNSHKPLLSTVGSVVVVPDLRLKGLYFVLSGAKL
jgi:hypothetical protein